MYYGPWHAAVKPSSFTTIEVWSWKRYLYNERGDIIAIEWNDARWFS